MLSAALGRCGAATPTNLDSCTATPPSRKATGRSKRPILRRKVASVAAGMFGVVTAQPVVPFLLSPENPAHRLGSNPQSPSQIVDVINDRDHTDSPIHPRHLDSHARNLTAQLLAEIHDQRCPRIQKVRRL